MRARCLGERMRWTPWNSTSRMRKRARVVSLAAAMVSYSAPSISICNSRSPSAGAWRATQSSSEMNCPSVRGPRKSLSKVASGCGWGSPETEASARKLGMPRSRIARSKSILSDTPGEKLAAIPSRSSGST